MISRTFYTVTATTTTTATILLLHKLLPVPVQVAGEEEEVTREDFFLGLLTALEKGVVATFARVFHCQDTKGAEWLPQNNTL